LTTVASTLTRFSVGFNHLTGSIPATLALPDPGASSLCPNQLTAQPSPAWDFATGDTPWYATCSGSYLDTNQFGLTGAWYEPATSGQGILLDIAPDLDGNGAGILFGGWFTYLCTRESSCDTDPTTVGAQHWYSFQGAAAADDPYSALIIYENIGGNFDAPPRTDAVAVGTASIAFIDCTHGVLSYHFADAHVPDGSITLQRLTASTTCTTDGGGVETPSNSLLSGAWYDPATSGQGMMFDISSAQNAFFAGWYTYADDGASGDPTIGQRWYSLQANIESDATSFTDVPIFVSTGGLFDSPVDPVTTVPVGTADITFESCTEVTVTYTFTSGENAGTSGTLHMTRLLPAQGACAI
jgi:hypothetical protein